MIFIIFVIKNIISLFNNNDKYNCYFHLKYIRINHYCMEIESIKQNLKYNIYFFQQLKY